ncbi:hypothetical protein ERO13_D04G181650v2 [Gossypium hirsutum]|uniref:Uncharacterized protein n=4 Tax=Gossypium TaxID=3633 RepID=A0A5J5S164_GOSBA|nr:hypothetical protein ES319_D04G211600v1 [Gossypium barbadense]KAG4153414.1 hypothetical protein ERO13_D04G181650v2 [Gossypium hirsutum]TYG74915.1 hypothetical protein ES288_D04G221900v1 [Gossypium darwinii]TYH78403.1 hypothetical protein ES332_D04G223700v1 [Gossypium tomentosum]
MSTGTGSIIRFFPCLYCIPCSLVALLSTVLLRTLEMNIIDYHLAEKNLQKLQWQTYDPQLQKLPCLRLSRIVFSLLMHLLEFVQSSMCCIVRRRPSWVLFLVGIGLESFVGLWAVVV